MKPKLNEVYRKAAAEFARRVASTLGDQLDSIVLYGSVARGEAKRNSDIDILVVTLRPGVTREKISEICSDFTYENDYAFFVSLVHFGREELDRLREVRSPFIANVLSEGVILHDNGTFSGVREKASAAS